MADLNKVVSSQAVEITDGVSQTAVIMNSSPVGTESGLVVRHIPSGTQVVSGTVTAVPTGTTTVTGTVNALFTGTSTVTGTVNSIPTGTANVAGTVTAVPTGTTTVAGTVNSTVTGTVTSVPTGTTTVTGTVNTVLTGGTITAVPTGTTTIAGTVSNSPANFVSTANSTTTILAANATFTGTAWEDVSGFSLVSIVVFSDQSSAANGLVYNWSSNGSTTDDTEQFSVNAASAGYGISLPPEARYFKVSYTNGATAQATFRLQVLFKTDSPVMALGRCRQSNPLTQHTDNQRVGLAADGIGRLITTPFHCRQMTVRVAVVITTVTETTLIAAAGAGVFQDMTGLHVCNLTATAFRVDFRDTTGGTVVFSLNVPATGDANINFTQPLYQATANTNWTASISVALTSGCRITATAVKNV